MKADDFYRIMKEPSLLSEETLPGWKEIIDDFPWFQTARMLYLKNLAVTEDIRFIPELQRMSVYIIDRKKLFMLIEGQRYGLQTLLTEEKAADDENQTGFSLIDSFLSTYEHKKESDADSTLLFRPSVSSDYIYWALSNESMPEEEKTSQPLQHQELIDSFIRDEEERPSGSRLSPDDAIEDKPAPESIKGWEDDNPESLDDSYFTETLARIYVKQKRYDKALQIIKTLSLNYPEKSIYFADQIRFLEKLIINTKK